MDPEKELKKAFTSAAVIAALLGPDLCLDAPAHASVAMGDVTVAREDGAMRASFTATGQADGSAVGQIQLYDPTPLGDQDVDGTGDSTLAETPGGVAAEATVNCLVVDGGRAIVGGEVTHSNVKRYLGKKVLLFLEDGASARFSWGFYEVQQDVFCDSYPWAAHTPDDITAGSLQVQQ